MKQTNYKKVPFDLELAKKITNKEVKGRIVNGMGSEVRIIYFDKMGIYPIVGLTKIADEEEVHTYSEGGCCFKSRESSLDLHIEVPTYYKDYSNFEPQKWQPCLVRDNEKDAWIIMVCAGKDTHGDVIFYNEGFISYKFIHVLPLSKVTERLFGTSKSYEELIQELDAELTALKTNSNE